VCAGVGGVTSVFEGALRTGSEQRDTAEGEESLPDHLCELQPGKWALWREVGLRAPGFPVNGLQAFGAPDEGARLRELARDRRFLEAVTWQNRPALHNAVAKVGIADGRDDSATRRRLDVVASYWQRYCAKNETIGFFGPMGWATVIDGDDAIVQRPGPQLLADRQVRFEVWAIQALADALAEDSEVRRWLAPRRRPDRAPSDLGPDDAAVYTACDGRTPAWQVGHPAVLTSLVERELVQWDLPVPLGPHPERHLRATLGRIGDEEVRTRAIAHLDDLEGARSVVAAAAGNQPPWAGPLTISMPASSARPEWPPAARLAPHTAGGRSATRTAAVISTSASVSH